MEHKDTLPVVLSKAMQVMKCLEEIAELQKELRKHPVRATEDEEIADEIVGVEKALEQMKEMLGY